MRKFPGLEAILVQKNSIIPRTIELTFQELLDLSDNGKIPLTPEVLNSKYKVLADFISKEMNFKLDVLHSDFFTASAIYYSWNESHVLTDIINKPPNDYKQILTFLKKKEGYLDKKNVRVEGYFSNQPAIIALNFNRMVSEYKFTSRNLTGTFLHELGHCWNVMEYSDRMQNINQVLAEALNVDIKDKKDKNKYILKLASENEIITKAEYEEMLKSDGKYVTSLSVLRMFTKKIINLTNSSYTSTSSEALADNFATKFGYGRDVIDGIDKMYRYEGVRTLYSDHGQFLEIVRSLLDTVKLLVVVSYFLLLPALFAIGLSSILIIFVGLYLTSFLSSLGLDAIGGSPTEEHDARYDTVKRRFQRIKNTIVNDLKHERDPRFLKRYVEQIEEIEMYINKSHEHKTLWKWLSLTFSQSARTEDMQMREEQMLEDLIANDLYLASVKLKMKYA